MRVFDPAKGTILRKVDGPTDGSRAAQMERKVLAAALALLKEEDDELGKILTAALSENTRRAADLIKSLIKASDEERETSLKELRAAIREVGEASKAKDHEKDFTRLSERLRDAERAIDSHHRLLAKQVEDLGDALADAIKDLKKAATAEPPKKPTKWVHKIKRGADGKATDVISTPE